MAIVTRFYDCMVLTDANMLSSAFANFAITVEGRIIFCNGDWIFSCFCFLRYLQKMSVTSYNVSTAITFNLWKFCWFPPKDIAEEMHFVYCYYLSNCLQGLQYQWAEAVFMLFHWEAFILWKGSICFVNLYKVMRRIQNL